MRIIKFVCLLSIVFLLSCDQSKTAEKGIYNEIYYKNIINALSFINKYETSLTLPKAPYPISTSARLETVNKALADPFYVIDLSNHINATEISPGKISASIKLILSTLELTDISSFDNANNETSTDLRVYPSIPDNKTFNQFIKRIIDIAHQYDLSKPDISEHQSEQLSELIIANITKSKKLVKERLLLDSLYHEIGIKHDLQRDINTLISSLTVIEEFLEEYEKIETPITWDSPYGKILVAGKENNFHTGEYFIIIDLGGDDKYMDVGQLAHNGKLSLVLDFSGNDIIEWTKTSGPGAGILNANIWVDIAGDDHYSGSNIGMGVGILGLGLLLDSNGNDTYTAGSYSMGAGHYGLGLHIDTNGNDSYTSQHASQGFGGVGGVGLLIDAMGNDNYNCEKALPDIETIRIERHKEPHYINMCQGYAFGERPTHSGGIGLLLDKAGNDNYQGDIFAQGGAYWFGLGLLIDSAGNDNYSAFEHAQGAALHLAAGYLFDFNGNDTYKAYEHAQGTGLDRSMGMLIDYSGNDKYSAFTESQGSGIKPYGVGIMIDVTGDDFYKSSILSQGFSKTLNPRFPKEERPIGILIDKNGEDNFYLEYVDSVNRIRIQNDLGITLDL